MSKKLHNLNGEPNDHLINPRLMGDHHRALVLNLLRVNGPISRSAIARYLGLSPSVMTRMMRRLLDEGSVREIGEVNSGVGRRPVLLEFNDAFATAVGVHIQQDKVECALVDLGANILSRSETVLENPTNTSEMQNLLIRSLVAMIQEDTVGIGIAVSGLIDVEAGEDVFSPVLDWHNVPLRIPLENAVHLPVFIENDANALALAEHLHGSGREFDDVICVMVGEGVGGGIIINGELHRGALGASGEIGHTTLQLDGPQCRCGEKGCLEEYCSNRALLRKANELGHQSVDSLANVARSGDREATEVFREMGQNLGIGVKDVVNIVSPEVVVLGGERMKDADLFFEDFTKTVLAHAFPQGGPRPEIFPWETGHDGFLLGAAGLVSMAFLRSPVAVGRGSLSLRTQSGEE